MEENQNKANLSNIKCLPDTKRAIIRMSIYSAILLVVGVSLTLLKLQNKVNYAGQNKANVIYVILACVVLLAGFVLVSVLSILHKEVVLKDEEVVIKSGIFKVATKSISLQNIKGVYFNEGKAPSLKIEYLCQAVNKKNKQSKKNQFTTRFITLYGLTNLQSLYQRLKPLIKD